MKSLKILHRITVNLNQTCAFKAFRKWRDVLYGIPQVNAKLQIATRQLSWPLTSVNTIWNLAFKAVFLPL